MLCFEPVSVVLFSTRDHSWVVILTTQRHFLLWPETLTYNVDLWPWTHCINQRVRYLGERLSISSVVVQAHTHPFNGPLSGTTRVSRYQKSKTKTNVDFTEARDSEWQWHQLGYMQVCILLQTTMPAPHHSCPSCHPTNSVKALKTYADARIETHNILIAVSGPLKWLVTKVIGAYLT